MQTDKDQGKAGPQEPVDVEQDQQDENMSWLLDMDLSEPEEKLFTVTGNEYQDEGLSAFEAEVAARPLIRGNTSGDDLASYVDEEIVISSEDACSDIYADSAGQADGDVAQGTAEELMAIDFSLERDGAESSSAEASIDDGQDILGLASDDDIGEKFLSIKRVKPVSAKAGKAVAAESAQPVVAGMETSCELQSTGSETSMPAAFDSEDDLPASLSDAPVTTQVADPQVDSVANDWPSLEAEVDDGELDLAMESDIDFSDALLATEEVETGPGVEISDIIAAATQDILRSAHSRAASLGLGDDAVAVDVMIGADEEVIKRCYADGYEPVSAILSDLPGSLQSLGAAERDAIYVRLQCVNSGENWNDMFSEDFRSCPDDSIGTEALEAEPCEAEAESLLADAFDVEEELSGIENALEETPVENAFLQDADLEAGFGEDIFGDTFEDEFTTALPTDDVADIDSAFSDMSGAAGIDEEISGLDFDEFENGDEVEEPIEAECAAVEEIEQPAVEVEDTSAASEPAPEVAQGKRIEDIVDLSSSDWCIPASIEFSQAGESNGEIFAEFLDAFIEEGSVEVEKLESLVGEWEKEFDSESIQAEVARTLHTIKGIAKGVGLQRMGTLVHNYETLLDHLPQTDEADAEVYFRVVNAWLDAVVRGIEFITDNRVDIASELPVIGREAPVSADVTDTSSQDIDTAASEEAPVAMPKDPASEESLSALEKKRDQQLADEGAKVLAAQQSVRITSEKLDHMLNLASQAQQLGVRASQNTNRSKRSSAELQGRLTSVRNHISQIADRALLNVNVGGGNSNSELDALEMDQYSELQEAASILREGVEDLGDLVDVVSRQNVQIEALLKQQSSVISSISSSIQGARVVPVSRLMPGLRRIVRTVSTDLGKVVTFKVLNETGALDRDHYARLQVVVEHMVRNALDHGIETPEERLAAGKPTGGRITIDVRKAGGDYVVLLSDDGRGIDADAIRESAYNKGLDVDVDALSDEEAMRLIFHKGFSTASTVSEVSGRGVGMDIVLTELQQMGGDIQIKSAVGLGTSFEVRIPSNVSVNGALLVAAGEESYAIPLNGLVAVEQVTVADFYAAIEQGTTLRLFDADCEPAYLATLCKGQGLPDRSVWENSIPVIIAGTGERHMAIAIDNLEEALELVVRSLGSQFAAVPGLAGAATTSDGEAIVALDLNLLVNSVGTDGLASIHLSESEDRALLALVVDDSRTQRMVATSQLDTVGVETITAENGLVAIDLLNAAHRLPDVVLLDVEMPVKDGIETLREIRKSQRYGDLPVIMVTSRTGAKHRALAKTAGCNAYMGKPFNFPALIEQINDLTGHDLQLS